jgi:hypothetical protein
VYPPVCLCSQDQLHTGYNVLTRTLPWFLKEASDMEHDDYTRMLKMVCFTDINDYNHVEFCLA